MKRRLHRPLGVLVVACVFWGCDSDSVMRQPCVPALLTPVENAVMDNGCFGHTDPKTWTFAWGECEEAEFYHIFVAGRGAELPFIDRDDVRQTIFGRSDSGYVIDANRHDWYWRVRAQTRGEWDPWSPERPFEVEPRDTDCP